LIEGFRRLPLSGIRHLSESICYAVESIWCGVSHANAMYAGDEIVLHHNDVIAARMALRESFFGAPFDEDFNLAPDPFLVPLKRDFLR
jgi:hypothetical protein